MASRTRNRVLWIAALVGVAVTTALVVLVSHSGNRAQVTPLREEKTGAKSRSSGDNEARPKSSVVTPALRTARAAPRDRSRGGARPAHSGSTVAKTRKHEGIQPVQSADASAPRARAVPTAPVHIPAAPAASIPPSDPPATPPAPLKETRNPDAAPVSPALGPAPSSREADIEIRDGELRKAPGHMKPRGQHVTLRVRSDELTIVEIDGTKPGLTLLAGKETTITLDAHLAKHLEVELDRRAGVLVLRLDD